MPSWVFLMVTEFHHTTHQKTWLLGPLHHWETINLSKALRPLGSNFSTNKVATVNISPAYFMDPSNPEGTSMPGHCTAITNEDREANFKYPVCQIAAHSSGISK